MSDQRDQRQELYEVWQIQDGLLQQYRVIAVAFQGLLMTTCIGLLSFVSSTFASVRAASESLPTVDALVLLLATVTYLLMVALGFLGARQLKQLCLERAKIVRFCQKLLIDDEGGVLYAQFEKVQLISGGETLPIMQLTKLIAYKNLENIDKYPKHILAKINSESVDTLKRIRDEVSVPLKPLTSDRGHFFNQTMFNIFEWLWGTFFLLGVATLGSVFGH